MHLCGEKREQECVTSKSACTFNSRTRLTNESRLNTTLLQRAVLLRSIARDTVTDQCRRSYNRIQGRFKPSTYVHSWISLSFNVYCSQCHINSPCERSHRITCEWTSIQVTGTTCPGIMSPGTEDMRACKYQG